MDDHCFRRLDRGIRKQRLRITMHRMLLAGQASRTALLSMDEVAQVERYATRGDFASTFGASDQ
jgi:hypothetical protein